MSPPSPSAARRSDAGHEAAHEATGPAVKPQEDEQEEEGEEEEEEELMFAFEADAAEPELQRARATPALFRSISDVHPLSRPANPLAAVLQREAEAEPDAEAEAELAGWPAARFRSFAADALDFNGRRKRKAAAEAPGALQQLATRVIRPVPKRARLDRSATAPPCFMRAPSPAGRPLSRSSSSEPGDDRPEPSACIAIPASAFRPIRPASSSLAGSAHSSASSAKSWTSAFCRRSLDVSSPVRSRLGDLVLGSSAARTASFDAS